MNQTSSRIYALLKELIANLNIIDKHTAGMDKSVKKEARETMISQLLTKEGTIVSRRRKLTASRARELADTFVGFA